MEQPWDSGSERRFCGYTVVAARHAHAINSPLSDVELASFPCSYSTAENMLTRANVGASDVVLVTGASGGVGSAAIQLAKARGAQVIAITSPSKAEALLALGASQTLDRHADLVQALGKNSVTVVIDLAAGPQWPSLLEVLKPFGRYATAGAIAGPMVELDVRTLYLKDLSLFGCTVLGDSVFANLVRHIEAGDIQPLVSQVFPLDQIREARVSDQGGYDDQGPLSWVQLAPLPGRLTSRQTPPTPAPAAHRPGTPRSHSPRRAGARGHPGSRCGCVPRSGPPALAAIGHA